MITQKTKYALKALMVLGESGNAALTIEEIARRSTTPKRFLEHILLELRKSGHVVARRGRSGGYSLAKPPEKIALGDVLRQIDGPIAPLPCLSRTAYHACEDCASESDCQLRRVFGQLFYSYLLLIESLSLRDLLTRGGEIAAGVDVLQGDVPGTSGQEAGASVNPEPETARGE